MNALNDLGLVPPGTESTSHLCNAPRELWFGTIGFGTDKALTYAVSYWHTAFDTFDWTCYSTVNVLERLVDIEERQIQRRLGHINQNGWDSGRPEYTSRILASPRRSHTTSTSALGWKNPVCGREENEELIHLGELDDLCQAATERQ
jgi:hypothetical protein